jgi:hypothetical protein
LASRLGATGAGESCDARKPDADKPLVRTAGGGTSFASEETGPGGSQPFSVDLNLGERLLGRLVPGVAAPSAEPPPGDLESGLVDWAAQLATHDHLPAALPAGGTSFASEETGPGGVQPFSVTGYQGERLPGIPVPGVAALSAVPTPGDSESRLGDYAPWPVLGIQGGPPPQLEDTQFFEMGDWYSDGDADTEEDHAPSSGTPCPDIGLFDPFGTALERICCDPAEVGFDEGLPAMRRLGAWAASPFSRPVPFGWRLDEYAVWYSG